MKSISIFFIVAIIFISSFLVSTQSFSMVSTAQSSVHVEYKHVDGEYCAVYYAEDGSILYVQPIDEE